MITIDGTTYNIPIKTVGRKAEILFKYAERLENGNFVGETIGTFYNYDVEAGMSQNNVADYAALWLKITDPAYEHEITLPDEDGDFTFDCYFANMRDEVKTWKDGGIVFFRNMSFSVIAISPTRTP